jgi:hypothetical protein
MLPHAPNMFSYLQENVGNGNAILEKLRKENSSGLSAE